MDTEKLKILSIAVVNDAQNSFGIINVVIQTIISGAKLSGTVFTVKKYPGSIQTVYKTFLEAKANDKLVGDGEADSCGALSGGFMAMQFHFFKLGGFVIDGVVRDSAGIQKLGLPVLHDR